MDIADAVLIQPTSLIGLDSPGEAASAKIGLQRRAGEVGDIPEQKKEQIAKDFESILISKLFDEVKNTVGQWGFDQDAASGQIQGMFWLYLARDIANKGGFGLWKDVYKFVTHHA
jgi:Rod binding domain-containing protein